MKYLSILLLFILMTNCNKKSQVKNLIYESDVDKINVTERSLTRFYINGEKTIKFNLTPKDINDFFDYLAKKKVEEIEQRELNLDCEVITMPSFSYKLEILFENENTYQFTWISNNCGEQVDNLSDIVGQLYKMINKDKAVEEFEKTDFVFM